MSKIRVTVFQNNDPTNGKILIIPATFDEFLSQLFESFGIKPGAIFNEHGARIESLDVISDKDVIYVSTDPMYPLNSSVQYPVYTRIQPYPARSIQNYPIRKSDNISKFPKWITLNVGGKYFTTSLSTLRSDPENMLARMFSETRGCWNQASTKDASGAYLIDRNPTYFEPILNYLRLGKLIYNRDVNPEGILEEARFFCMQSLIPQLEQIVQEQRTTIDDFPLTRRDVVKALIGCCLKSELRFQGVNLSGADLSKLDLRNINFKYANLKGCKLNAANLSWCCLERADLSHTVLDGAQLLGVRSLCANFEGALMRNCNFEDPGGSRANMEGVNLKGTDLECSQMGAINLRVATLKNANLKNCDLRGAVLAGADLEFCDLSGSDLHEANLRGANLKDAAFELMLTPLHMSQTV